MLKTFDSLCLDWVDCLVDRDYNSEGWIVWREDRETPLLPGYAVAVPLPYDTEHPKTIDFEYWLLRVWFCLDDCSLDIDWHGCSPDFVDWRDWVYQQWFDAGFAEAVPIDSVQ